MAEDTIYLTVGKDPQGQMLAIISQGQGQFGDEQVTVLSVTKVKNMKEAKKWWRKMRVEKPWEVRN